MRQRKTEGRNCKSAGGDKEKPDRDRQGKKIEMKEAEVEMCRDRERLREAQRQV